MGWGGVRVAVHPGELITAGRERSEQAWLVEEARELAVAWRVCERCELPESIIDAATLLIECLEVEVDRLGADEAPDA